MAAHHPLPRSGTHVMIATLVLMMMMMTLPSATADPTPISPAAGPLVGNELPHSTYSWDFGSVLGTTSGWWASWFPQCTQPYQAPINITTDTIINNAATKTLVLQTVSGKPMGLFDAIVAYNSTFNMVRCDVSSDHFLFYFYWAEDVTTPEQIAALPTFALNRFTVRFPSEHEINGQQTSVELRYVFSSTTRIASGQPTDITDESIGPNSSVSIVILLNETLDNEGDDNIELLFKQLMAGYSAGSTKIKAFFPSYETLYYYRGSQSIPPCAGGVDYFIGPTIYPIEASTLKLLQKYGPTWTSYRPIQATEGRPIMEVKAEMVNVLPKYRTTPAPVRYQVMDESLSFNGYGQRYGAWMAGLMCALLACCILFLLIERGTYTLPYYLSWRCPNSAREVFGVPVYFHCESGAPLMDDGTAPSSAGGSHNDDDEHRSSGGLGGGVGGSGGTNEAISSSTPLSVHSGHVATAEEGKKLTSSDESVSKPPAGGGVAGASSPHMQKVPIAEAGDDDDEDVDDVGDDDDEHNNSSM